MRTSIIILLFCCCIISCKDKNAVPSGILKREKMQAVLWDVIRAQVFTNIYIKRDSTKKDLVLEDAKLQQQIFSINNITREDFYNSYDYYKKNPQLMKVVLDSMQTDVMRQRIVDSKNDMPFHPPFPSHNFPINKK